ncbi:hypothetical protein, partial [Streptococcus pseudopneumoniae]|uniref:hypothetical protein n=1 Tax=Streptococcus pseudopneumoniae TaxID=257758 RepID=UPI002E373BD3
TPEQPTEPSKPADGSMGTGFLFGNSSFYYLNSNSSMTRGWKKKMECGTSTILMVQWPQDGC